MRNESQPMPPEVRRFKAASPDQKGFMEKMSEHKAALLFMAASAFASMEAATPQEVMAEFTKPGKKAEQVVSAREINQSRETANHFELIEKNTQEAKDDAGRWVRVTTARMESDIDGDGKMDKEAAADLTMVNVHDEGNPKISGDERIYNAKFIRNAAGKVDMSIAFQGQEDAPDFITKGVTPEMRAAKNPSIQKSKLRSFGHHILVKLRVLRGLKSVVKADTPEYKHCLAAVKDDVERAQKQFGGEAVDAPAIMAEVER